MLSRPENNQDRSIADALTSAAAAHDLPFLKAVATIQGTLAGRAPDLLTIVAQH